MEKIIEAILVICAASSVEDLDESVLEKFEHYAAHPVEINFSTRSRLLSTGLFSAFQVASLLDYRARCGDILSSAELGAIDGFGPAFAEALRPFVRFSSQRSPGQRPPGRDGPEVSGKLTAKGSVRSDKGSVPFGVKAEAALSDRLEIGWASRTTYSDPDFTAGTMNVTFYGRKSLGKLVLGDFNARFGQGLMVWNGFSLSSHTTASSILRNASGISPSHSFSAARHGLAADFELGMWTVSAALDRSRETILAASFIRKTWGAGLTIRATPGDSGVSADWRAGFPGGAAFGEIAFDGKLKVLAGAFHVPAYGSKIAARSSWSPEEHSAVAAFSNRWLDISAEGIGRIAKGTGNVRTTAIAHPVFGIGASKLTSGLRASVKYSWGRSPLLRTDLRAEGGYERGGWSLKGRFDAVFGRGFAWLWYLEAGHQGPFSAFLRGGIFKADSWDDRIYVYERDAPGAFNVPAYYGRGWNVSIFTGWKSKKRALHLRASYVCYPMGGKESPFELRLQYSRSFRQGFRSGGQSRSRSGEDGPRSRRQTR